ncbi:MAG: hypothetical protein HQ526_02490 [Actinobacteria bacterium]|nr:hypothetical protein [Actinomycetota bacterium]
MAVGIFCALLAAFFFAIGSILQSYAASRTESAGALDPRFFIRMLKQLPYLVGLASDFVGFLFSLVALQFLPLFLSEALLASSVGITAILAVLFLKVKLSPMERLAVPGLIVGLVCLAISAQPGEAAQISMTARWFELVGVAVIVILAVLSTKLPPAKAGVAVAIVSGLSFSGMGIATRSLDIPDQWWMLIREPDAYAVLLYGAIGIFMFASALQRASVTTVSALVFGLETLIPSIVGIAFLGDTARAGLWPLAVVGFVISFGAALVLAGQAEPAVTAEPGT